ncbi:MAG: class I SAM-dependent methyltransferase [Xanthomonadales bacterium]|nr:class I SAM-dependent methyltransferase [Xanthomonadales bacterium]
MSVGGLARRLLAPLRRTPLHPQWLLGPARRLAPWVREHARGRVLDVGCADRWVRGHLPEDAEYVALDYPATGAGLYRARPDLFGDAARLPIRSATFDTVVMLEVLEHLRYPREALAEARRVLTPGGIAIVSMPFLYPLHDAPHDYQRYTRHGLERELAASGLAIRHLQPSLGSVASAALLFNIALAGTVLTAARRRHPGALLAPALLALIPLVNLAGWLLGHLLPDWEAFTSGFVLVARAEETAGSDGRAIPDCRGAVG